MGYSLRFQIDEQNELCDRIANPLAKKLKDIPIIGAKRPGCSPWLCAMHP